ncbi:hypothetical protein AAIB48_02215 [Paraclostridium benzoelyticum]|uniref:hypothetical protein n=1 Tax=Paraclostridium benzoelyticum TaxID=1629550 RepID=UPI0031CD840C
MPFHTKNLVENIKKNLEKSSLKEEDKYILKFTLDKMGSSVLEDNSSIFQYANVLNVLNKGVISKNDYKEFGLFYDENLLEDKTTKMIKSRLNENASIFSKIDSIHKYGNPEIELEKDFDPKGVESLKRDSWKDVSYKDIKISIENIKGTKKVKLESIKVSDNLVFWDKPEGESEARQRKRNIIIFNKDKLNTVSLEFKFDIPVKRPDFKLDKKTQEYVNIAISKEKVKVSIVVDESTNTFAKIKYDDKRVKFEFRVCVVSCEEDILENIKTNFEVLMKSKKNMIVANTDEEKIVLNPKGSSETQEYITQLENSVILDTDEKMELLFAVKTEEETEFAKVDIKYNDSVITIAKEEEKERPSMISGLRVWKQKEKKKKALSTCQIIN